MSHSTCICFECERERRDAMRFRFLPDLTVVEAQAFFWNWPSRKQRIKEIDAEMSRRAPTAPLEEPGWTSKEAR